MPEETSPERLRALADRCEPNMPASSQIIFEARDAMRGAADELERLARPAPAPDTLAARIAEVALVLEADGERRAPALLRDAADELARLAGALGRPFVDALEVLERFEAHEAKRSPAARAKIERGVRLGSHAGGLRTATAIVRELAGLDGDAPLHELGAELARDAGVAVPMPQPRRFAARYTDPQGGLYPRPAPGSFVFAGPALAVWRVLGVDPLDGDSRGTHALELEPVDAHDVPTLARVAEVPAPVSELMPEPQPVGVALEAAEPGGPVDVLLADPERSLALCSATWTPPTDGSVEPVQLTCVRVHAHAGEHLFRGDGFEHTSERPWDGHPRVVDRDSSEAQDALWQEGQGGAQPRAGGVRVDLPIGREGTA